MAMPNIQMTKLKERCTGCCRNENGSCRWGLIALCVVLASVVIAAILALSLAMAKKSSTFFYREIAVERSNVFASDESCEQVARETLALGGNSMDAVVAGAFCLSVVRPQSAGLGGSLILLHFKDGAYSLEALEQAPNVLEPSQKVGVPGFLRGLKTAHKEFGHLNFCSLLLPAILLASNGFCVSKKLALDLKTSEERLSPELKKYFSNPDTGRLFQEGETMKMENYAQLLRYICTLGPNDFYFGLVADYILDDMRKYNLTISREDLRAYEVQIRPPGRLSIGNHMSRTKLELVFAPNAGSGGETSALAVAILAQVFRSRGVDPRNDRQAYHATVEALKFAFARRAELNGTLNDKTAGDSVRKLLGAAAQRIVQEAEKTYNYPANYGTRNFIPPTMESHSASIGVVGRDGDLTLAVMSLTSAFGSGILLNKTGVILNDALSRFSVAGAHDDMGSTAAPASVAGARRRPVSALAPILVLAGGPAHPEVLMAINSDDGGNQMISTTAQILSNTLLRGFNVSSAMSQPRVHHQLSPNVLYVDNRPPLGGEVAQQLASTGHVLQDEALSSHSNAFSIITQAEPDNDKVTLCIDVVKELS